MARGPGLRAAAHSFAVLLALVVAVPGGARAQESWDWAFAPYLWTAGVEGDTRLGPLPADVDLAFSDIVDALDGVALVHVEAHKSDHALFGDLVFLGTEPEANVEFDTLIVEAGYLHKFPSSTGINGLELGVRYWDFELAITPGPFPTVEGSEDWLDAFVGYRRDRPIDERWRYIARANIGAGGTDVSWAFDLVFLREFSNSNSLAVGVKILDIDYEDGGPPAFGLDTTFLGGAIGYFFD